MNTAIILGAGADVDGTPPSFIRYRGKSILSEQVRVLRSAGVDQIVLVRRPSASWSPQRLTVANKLCDMIITNEEAHNTGSTRSLALGLTHVLESDRIIVLDSDISINESVVQGLLKSRGSLVIGVTKRTSSRETGAIIENIPKRGYYLKEIDSQGLSEYVLAGAFSLRKQGIQLTYKTTQSAGPNERVSTILSKITNAEAVSAHIIRGDHVKNLYVELGNMAGGSYARTFHLQTNSQSIVRKTIEHPGIEKLREEVNFIQALPSSLRKRFPQIISSHLPEKPARVDFKYYDMDTIRTHVLTGTWDARTTMNHLDAILDFLVGKLYPSSVIKTPRDYLLSTHVLKTRSRLYRMQLEHSGFSSILSVPTLTINGRQYRNVLPILAELMEKPRVLELLEPKKLYRIHGDLHFDNILHNGNDFILIDPRGWDHGDVAYDFGKVLHSCHSVYDLIHTYQFEYWYTPHGGHEFHIRSEHQRTFSDIHDAFRTRLQTLSTIFDNALVDRSYFSEAMHFASMLPFQLAYDGEETKAKAIYLTGVMLLNDFMDARERLINKYEAHPI